MKKLLAFSVSIIVFSLFMGQAVSGSSNNDYSGKNPKYVFLFIGDGMALPQVSSAEIYAGAIRGGSLRPSSSPSLC